MANEPYRHRPDGIVLNPGDWLSIEGLGVGRFSGCWHNPDLGYICSLTYYRKFSDPGQRTTLWSGDLRTPGNLLDRAERVTGPMKANGKRPAPLPPPGGLH